MFSTIKKFRLVITLAVFSIVAVSAQDATIWQLDRSHTSVNFSVNRFFTTIKGSFKKFHGNVSFDKEYLKDSKIEFTILSNSINTNNEQRDKHLLSKDFLDADKYPSMNFKSMKIEKNSDTEYLLYGKLTIKDKTKDVILPMKINGEIEHPMMEGVFILGVSINTTIDRTDYGIGTGDWGATSVISDEVEIHIPMDLALKK